MSKLLSAMIAACAFEVSASAADTSIAAAPRRSAHRILAPLTKILLSRFIPLKWASLNYPPTRASKGYRSKRHAFQVKASRRCLGARPVPKQPPVNNSSGVLGRATSDSVRRGGLLMDHALLRSCRKSPRSANIRQQFDTACTCRTHVFDAQ